MEAALRPYFKLGRNADVLLSDYDARVLRSSRRTTAAREFANGRSMLERLVALDRPQPDPTRVLLGKVQTSVLGHGLTMGVDWARQTDSGWVIRQWLSDDEIRRTDHVKLYAAATALHFAARPDGGPVDRVEIWLLRFVGRVAGWPTSLLDRMTSSLASRLDEIAAGASGQAA